jgi:hypothetical protein
MRGKRKELLSVIFGCSFLAAAVVSVLAAVRGDNAVVETLLSACTVVVGTLILSLAVT